MIFDFFCEVYGLVLFLVIDVKIFVVVCNVVVVILGMDVWDRSCSKVLRVFFGEFNRIVYLFRIYLIDFKDFEVMKCLGGVFEFSCVRMILVVLIMVFFIVCILMVMF